MSGYHNAYVILAVIFLLASSSLSAFATTGALASNSTRQVTLIVDPAGSDGFKKVQWALENATDGDTILVYPGTYRESVLVDKGVTIKGSGSGQSFIDAGGQPYGLLVNHSNIKISGLNISNAHSGIQISAGYATLSDCAINGCVIGINMSIAGNCSLDSCASVGCSGAGLALNNSAFNTFSRCHFDSNGPLGAYLYNSSGNAFSGGSCSYNLGFGLFLDSGSHSAAIEGQKFDSNGYNGLTLSGSDRASIGNSSCRDNGKIGLFLSDTHDANILGVTADDNDGVGIYLNGSDGNRFCGCSCDSNGKNGVYLWMSEGNTFDGGSASQNRGWGIYLYWLSNGNIIRGYNCSNNKETGIYIGDSDEANITGCVCSCNTNSGIYLRTSDTSVSDCRMDGNGQYGAYLYYSDGVGISDCLIEKSGNAGLYSKFSMSNVISSNVIRYNPVGLKMLSDSDNNLITGNVIISQWMGRPQAVDDGKNTWNGPKIGNYWSDLVSNDTNLDGICDSPYAINGTGGGMDLYPSATPFDYALPIADAGPDLCLMNGSMAMMNGSRSYCSGGIANYTWVFEYNGEAVSLYGPYPMFNFHRAGNYTVTLTVSDAKGNTSMSELRLRVLQPEKGPSEEKSTQAENVRPMVLQVFFLCVTIAASFFATVVYRRRV